MTHTPLSPHTRYEHTGNTHNNSGRKLTSHSIANSSEKSDLSHISRKSSPPSHDTNGGELGRKASRILPRNPSHSKNDYLGRKTSRNIPDMSEYDRSPKLTSDHERNLQVVLHLHERHPIEDAIRRQETKEHILQEHLSQQHQHHNHSHGHHYDDSNGSVKEKTPPDGDQQHPFFDAIETILKENNSRAASAKADTRIAEGQIRAPKFIVASDVEENNTVLPIGV
eukprot:CAMPEP_0182431378 /NCGR_PEP_ID=MMETSP1167-20130531/48701_1 /TAXON_ID=2988 /ORGANISM="Mallomonas Sp, Strain CCMP3275" /LENGTH=224 /DNA_ID=CAMNT_0024617651 /DNA_START=362 /DNA_END=1036 /DNA_ORIENTATION=-